MALLELDEEKFSHITHDLRAPLCAIMGYLDLVGREVAKTAPPKTVEYLSLAQEAGRRMNQMVNDMLEMVRLENHQESLHLQAIPVDAIIHDVQRTFAGLAELKNIQLTCSIPSAATRIWADPRYIGRVLDNLLSNAIKFTPQGGSIGVQARRGAGRVTFEVSDTGRGIPPEACRRIFDKFQQIRASDEGNGYGLGLAVVKTIVQAHRGDIRVESSNGKGSSFIFWIPSASASAAH
jgi:signal transduction histidine kinase